jgi:ROS/MUCR transcriptional regulator protein
VRQSVRSHYVVCLECGFRTQSLRRHLRSAHGPQAHVYYYCPAGGSRPRVLNPGDTVNIPPDTMHWHGASPDRLFSHLALSEAGEQGQCTAWGEHVSDVEYNEAASGG